MRQSTDSKPLEKGGGEELERKVGLYGLRPGDGKQGRFESRCCPWVLFKKRRYYSKHLLLGAIASEAARQLSSSFFG